MNASLFKKLVHIVGASGIEDVQQVQSSGKKQRIQAVVYPTNQMQVTSIIQVAKQAKISLYPVSRGLNIGYGGIVPPTPNALIVCLERMEAIHDLDDKQGTVWVEPGVTQLMLYEYLAKKAPQWYADMTGAPSSASVLGNIIDGGFGHSRKGWHRDHILQVRGVLGDGSWFDTGPSPGVGPQCASVFIQSNFAIVTNIKISLMRKTPARTLFIVSIDTKHQLFRTLKTLASLYEQGILRGLTHVGNATRALVTTGRPPPYLVDDSKAQSLLQVPFIRFGQWTGIGALDGTAQSITFHKRLLRKSGLRFSFYTPRSLKVAYHITEKMKHWYPSMHKSIVSLMELDKLTQGIPTDIAMKNAAWRSTPKNMGILWVSPVLALYTDKAKQCIDTIQQLTQSYGFESPMTITIINELTVVVVLSIHFDVTNRTQTQQAHKLKDALYHAFEQLGVQTYRRSVWDMETIRYSRDHNTLLHSLKKTLDPHGIIAPGRYNIK